jgi:dTDP-4-dehydrorhamnose reductase
MQNIIGTGLSGLVGSRIVALLGSSYTFEDISRKTGTDIMDADAVLDRIAKSTSSVVLHLAAKTDVDGSESEKDLAQESDAWKINVEGTAHVVHACKQTGKRLIYISTDMVFSGDQELGEKYTEEDTPHPANYYAQTKFEAEKIIQTANVPFTILRIAYPYRANFGKKEYVRIFISLLSQEKPIQAVSDHYFTPTFIDDLPGVLDKVIQTNAEGIYHCVGDETVSPYIVAKKIAKACGFREDLITETTRSAFFLGRATRGFNLSLSNDRIKQLDVTLHSFSEGLQEIKEQIEKNREV